MKKSFLAVFALGLFSMGSYAQDNPAFKNGFSLKFGIAPGSKNFGDLSELNTLNYSEYLTEKAKFDQDRIAGNTPTSVPLEPTQLVNQTVGLGYGFELGTMFFLNSIDFHDQIRIGIDVTWFEMYYSSASYETYKPGKYGSKGTQYGENLKAHSIRPGAKLGVFVSYSPVDKFAIDLGIKAAYGVNVMAIIPGTVYEESYPVTYASAGGVSVPVGTPGATVSNGTATYKEDVGAAQVGTGLRMVPGLYVRYAPFFAGIDMPMGSLNYTGGLATSATLEDPSSLFGIAIEPSATVQKYKSKSNEFRILLGFKF